MIDDQRPAFQLTIYVHASTMPVRQVHAFVTGGSIDKLSKRLLRTTTNLPRLVGEKEENMEQLLTFVKQYGCTLFS
jgi:hypothetical protein